MAQKKGQTGNPNGRPKGKPNKVTADMKEFVTKLLSKKQKQLEKDFDALEPAERWRITEKLMGFVIPKQKAVETTINFDQLSDEQLDNVINELTKNVNDE